jgi:hypothetical protein
MCIHNVGGGIFSVIDFFFCFYDIFFMALTC